MNGGLLFKLIALAGIPILTGQALAGEKIHFKAQHINVATGSEAVEIGDEPGHTLAMFQAKGVGIRREGPAEPPYKIEIWGTGDYRKRRHGKKSTVTASSRSRMGLPTMRSGRAMLPMAVMWGQQSTSTGPDVSKT